MIPFLIYIIKSTLCLTFFYLFFKALLSRETFYRFNRFVLLAGMTICAILPVIELKVSQATVFQEPLTKIESLFITSQPSFIEIIPEEKNNIESEKEIFEEINYLDSNVSTEEIPESSHSSSFSLIRFIEIFYATGFFITIVFLFVSIFKMTRIIRNGTKIKKEKYTVVCVSKKICPFSWGRHIVLSESDYRQHPDEILNHERVHVSKRHSLDLLFTELFILFHWFNPVAWLLKSELQDVHEYEADRGVINQGIDATKYQIMLLKKAAGARSYAIANSFNHSKIKNRITMMLKKQSTQWARLKLLLFVPLSVVLLQAFARPEVVRAEESLIDSEGTIIFEEFQQFEEKPEIQQQEKRFVQKKPVSVLKNDTLHVSQPKNKIVGKSNNIIVKGLPESIQKIIIRGDTVIIIDDTNEYYYIGNSIEIDFEQKQFIYPDSTVNGINSLSQLRLNQEERLRQIEQLRKEFQKQSEERRKELQQQSEQRRKEIQQQSEKLRNELQKQSEERRKELQQQSEERRKELQQQFEQRRKEIQQQSEKFRNELQKQSEERRKELQQQSEERRKEIQQQSEKHRNELQKQSEITDK